MNREIKYYKHYFIDFYNSLDLATQRKIAYVLTPKQEIEKAINLKNQYYADKQ